VDEDGHAVRGVTVPLGYQSYSAKSRSNEEDRITDERGRAVFASQVLSPYFA
jgi:hypothetical protein